MAEIAFVRFLSCITTSRRETLIVSGKHMALRQRDFLKGAAGLACLPLLPVCGSSNGEQPAPPVSPNPALPPRAVSAWVPRGEEQNLYGLFKEMVEAATDFSWLSRGDRVFLKLSLKFLLGEPLLHC